MPFKQQQCTTLPNNNNNNSVQLNNNSISVKPNLTTFAATPTAAEARGSCNILFVTYLIKLIKRPVSNKSWDGAGNRFCKVGHPIDDTVFCIFCQTSEKKTFFKKKLYSLPHPRDSETRTLYRDIHRQIHLIINCYWVNFLSSNGQMWKK